MIEELRICDSVQGGSAYGSSNSTKPKLNGEEAFRYAAVHYDLRREVMNP